MATNGDIDTLIIGGRVCVSGTTEHVVGWVAIAGGRIAHVSEGTPSPADLDASGEIVDASGCIVAPGLVNAHTHLFQTFLRGIRNDLALEGWLDAVIWPHIGRFEPEDFYLAALLGAVENLRSGATALIENHYVHTDPRNTHEVARALSDSGIRAIVARGAVDRADALPDGLAPHIVEGIVESPSLYLRRLEEVVDAWHGKDGGRIRIAGAAQTAFLCTHELCEAVAGFASEHGLALHTHLAETSASVASTQREWGFREVAFFESAGFLSPATQVAHSIWIDDDEIAALALTGATAVHCPVSNGYLGTGRARVPEMRSAGVPVALGTDGAASNNRQDSFEVLKHSVLQHRVAVADPTVIDEYDALENMWNGGASALLARGELGKLEAGALADVLVVETGRPHLQPVYTAASTLVFNATAADVRDVFVGGHPVVRNHRCTTIDEDELIARVDRRVAELGFRSLRSMAAST